MLPPPGCTVKLCSAGIKFPPVVPVSNNMGSIKLRETTKTSKRGAASNKEVVDAAGFHDREEEKTPFTNEFVP
jgi:hypothetical protein